MADSIHRIDRELSPGGPRRGGVWPFLPAGFPDLDTTATLLRECARRGARGIEVGFPYSDPIADGPVIQEAFYRALAAGMRTSGVFDMVAGLRREVEIPLVAMVSASIVFRIGAEAFLSRAASAGFDGLIVPDLSLEEAPRIAELALAASLRLAMLVAPTTGADRMKRIAECTSGFLYYVSVAGVTGERDRLPADLAERVRALRRVSGRPVLVGFGLSRPAHVAEVLTFADGAIIGSAIVRAMLDAHRRGSAGSDLVRQVVPVLDALLSA